MTYATARRLYGGRSNPHDQLDRLCCAAGCKGSLTEDAPVPLCDDHMRIAFAHVLMDAEAMAATIATPAEYEDEAPAHTHDYRGASLTTIGFVYFVRFSDRVKIGFSANPAGRLKNIPHDEVLAIVPGTMADERGLHAQFARYRVTGEWFQADEDLLDFIAALPTAA